MSRGPRLASLALGVCLATPAAGLELRGVWVVRTALTSPADVDAVVDEAVAAGFNAVLVQVRGRGDAFYASQLVPRSRLLAGQPASFDPLGRLLQRAHARGLEVHGWINVLLSADLPWKPPPAHVLSQHPDWVMVPRALARRAWSAPRAGLAELVREQTRGLDDVEGLYLTPAAAGVHEHLAAVVDELVRGYALDGLHLDFIRYPGPEFDYSPVALEAFRRHRGEGDPLELPQVDPQGFAEFRRGLLTRLAGRLAEAARRARPGIVVSAAVVPEEAQAVHHKFQAWPEWVVRGILDVVCPMAYTPDDRLFQRQLERAGELSRGALWIGIGAYRQPVEGTIEKLRLARRLGVRGAVIFSSESLDAAARERLRREIFSPSAVASRPGPAGGR